ncbi:hypothetical protein [uncultured Parabacteroides sp.]|uniref:hypothetical protein n=1 Tax=uncultured Parabacteroides sp. TaxID=512312 RepID=UPI0026086DAB|nr:hypothetical protein [uncultured Parabacteroides sp.]
MGYRFCPSPGGSRFTFLLMDLGSSKMKLRMKADREDASIPFGPDADSFSKGTVSGS